MREHGCILSKFYIKPQPNRKPYGTTSGCILSKFYIKPQRIAPPKRQCTVVSYRNSTSNHNPSIWNAQCSVVVSYRNSTSNHNIHNDHQLIDRVVSYRNSTSNHNLSLPCLFRRIGCILSKFYIKPQPYLLWAARA